MGGNSLKKVLLFTLFLLCFTGCTSVREETIENIVIQGMTSNVDITNVYRTGYKYYLPKGLKNINSHDYNEVIYSERYAYYLYVDVVSYFNKIREEYQEDSSYYYSKALYKGNQFGYLQIKSLEEDKYFIEIMYNYAKIEVIVDYRDINEMLSFSMALLSSISYNDTIIASMIGNDTLNASEIEFNIFETAKNDSNYIQYDGSSSSSKNENVIPDTDLVN